MRAGPVRTRVLIRIFSGIFVLSFPYARKPNPRVPSSQSQAAQAALASWRWYCGSTIRRTRCAGFDRPSLSRHSLFPALPFARRQRNQRAAWRIRGSQEARRSDTREMLSVRPCQRRLFAPTESRTLISAPPLRRPRFTYQHRRPETNLILIQVGTPGFAEAVASTHGPTSGTPQDRGRG
jgi:hypothetical protein